MLPRCPAPMSAIRIWGLPVCENIHSIIEGSADFYKYKETTVFVDFAIDTYLSRKMHNSSAHIYTNDLYQGILHGVFSKRDFFNNYISTISPDHFKDYILNEANSMDKPFDEMEKVIKKIDIFNTSFFPFGKWIEVQDALRQMRDANFRKWKEAEWPGFFVEYSYSYYIIRQKIEEYIEYLNNGQKEEGLDFDLRFNSLNFYGDLKCSNFEKDDILLNDKSNIDNELAKFGRLWFLIYEIEVVKDFSLPGHPYTKKRLEFIRSIEPGYKLGEDDSYSSRLKAKVKFTRMKIIEINNVNASHLLKEGSSNFHQPNHGKVRNVKYMLNKRNVNNAVIYSYSVESID